MQSYTFPSNGLDLDDDFASKCLLTSISTRLRRTQWITNFVVPSFRPVKPITWPRRRCPLLDSFNRNLPPIVSVVLVVVGWAVDKGHQLRVLFWDEPCVNAFSHLLLEGRIVAENVQEYYS